MATNDLHVKINKGLFKGNNGAEGKYFREMFEVLLLEREGITPNATQQAEIDLRIAKAKEINKLICDLKGSIPLEEMVDPEPPVE